MSSEQPVDFFIVGLGNPGGENAATRGNSGWIFLDYLANCICMQSKLIEEAQAEWEEAEKAGTLQELLDKKDKEQTKIPKYDIPKYDRLFDCGSDIYDVRFSLTVDDTTTITGEKPASGKRHFDIDKTYRLLLIKPLTGYKDLGFAVKKVIERYPVRNLKQQLIVVCEDMGTLPGSIAVQDHTDTKGIANHLGLKSLSEHLKIPGFIRFRIGLGHASDTKKVEEFLSTSMSKNDQRELDMFGYCLDMTAQALQFFAYTGDLKRTKKKYASSKKLPSRLRTMEGLGFPFEVNDTRSEEEKKKDEAKNKKTEPKKEAEKKPDQKANAEKKPEAKKEAEKKPEVKKEAEKKPEVKKEAEKKPEVKKEAEKKPEVKKEAEKKPEAKKEAEKKPEVKKEVEKAPEVKKGEGKGKKK